MFRGDTEADFFFTQAAKGLEMPVLKDYGFPKLSEAVLMRHKPGFKSLLQNMKHHENIYSRLLWLLQKKTDIYCILNSWVVQCHKSITKPFFGNLGVKNSNLFITPREATMIPFHTNTYSSASITDNYPSLERVWYNFMLFLALAVRSGAVLQLQLSCLSRYWSRNFVIGHGGDMWRRHGPV